MNGILPMLIPLTDNMIDDILRSDRTFIILFYSDLSPMTPQIIEIFEDFDKQFKGKIDIYKCNRDKEHGKLQQYFQMNAIPAILMIKNNKAYVNHAGGTSVTAYNNLIKQGIIDIMTDQKQKKQPTGYVSIV